MPGTVLGAGVCQKTDKGVCPSGEEGRHTTKSSEQVKRVVHRREAGSEPCAYQRKNILGNGNGWSKSLARWRSCKEASVAGTELWGGGAGK